MVNYKVRTFCEPEDNDSVGAEVRIYSDENEVIDTILITTESRYEELVNRIDTMDANYLDIDELKEIMQNAQDNNIEVNATYFDGLTSSQFAKAEHNELHTNYFAPLDHAIETNRYGLGTTTKYGHVKTVNNLDSTSFINGEALSAFQGNVLRELINSMKKEITTWTIIECGAYGKIRVNAALRLCTLNYMRSPVKVTKNGRMDLHTSAIIPDQYRPALTLTTPLGYSNVFSEFILNSEGKVSAVVKDASKGSGTVNAQLFWRY